MWKVTPRDCAKAWAIPALSWGGGGGSSGSGTLHVLCGLYLAFGSAREAVMVCLGEGSSRSLVSAWLSKFPFPLGYRGCAHSPSGQPGCAPRVRGALSSHATLPAAMAPLWLCHLHLHPAADPLWNGNPANVLTADVWFPKLLWKKKHTQRNLCLFHTHGAEVEDEWSEGSLTDPLGPRYSICKTWPFL